MPDIAAFIDFQGTIGGGTDDISSLEFYSFAIDAIKRLNDSGIRVIGITNQSHIAKGELTWEVYEEKLSRLKKELRERDAYFDAVYCCPHSKNDNCLCRKPRTGMVDSALKDFDIDVEKSYVIGDMGMADIALAKNIGAKGILVLTGAGRGSMSEFRHTWADVSPDYVAENILEAVDYIVENI